MRILHDSECLHLTVSRIYATVKVYHSSHNQSTTVIHGNSVFDADCLYFSVKFKGIFQPLPSHTGELGTSKRYIQVSHQPAVHPHSPDLGTWTGHVTIMLFRRKYLSQFLICVTPVSFELEKETWSWFLILNIWLSWHHAACYITVMVFCPSWQFIRHKRHL